MQKKYLPIFSFLLLLIIATPFESGFTIQNPGWHTIIPSTSHLELIVWILIAIILFAYWKIIKKGYPIHLKIFLFHFSLSVPLVLYARFNTFIRLTTSEHYTDILKFITVLNTITYTSLILFLVSQVFFIIYIIKNKR
jgi:hypothetical protein